MSMYLSRKTTIEEIARPLCALAGYDDEKTVYAVEIALRQIKDIVEKEDNFSEWRVFWSVLRSVSENDY